MSQEMRFWTIMGLIVAIVGIWFSYKQLNLAQPSESSVDDLATIATTIKKESRIHHLSDFLSKTPSDYVSPNVDNLNLETIYFIYVQSTTRCRTTFV